jgi:non-ribosomal peptide synthetase component F
MGLLVKELGERYSGYAGGEEEKKKKEEEEKELEIQYSDYAEWQREWMRGEVLEAELRYWRGQLEGAPELLRLPTDRPRPPVETHRGARERIILPEDLTRDLKQLSRREGATLFMTLLSAFNALLFHYSGQEDICIGAPIANRDRVETEKLIGLFTNTLVLRADLSGDPMFCNLLRRVRQAALDAHSHQHLPFEKLVEASRPERDGAPQSMFNVWFVLHNAAPDIDLPGLAVTPLEMPAVLARYDLKLELVETCKRLVGGFEYKSELFFASTGRSMVEDFECLLQIVVSDAEITLSELSRKLKQAAEARKSARKEAFRQERSEKLRRAIQQRGARTQTV